VTTETRYWLKCVQEELDLKEVLLLSLCEGGFPGVVCITKLSNAEGLGSKLFKLSEGLQVSV